jgi:transcription-repair coupling factor (superfamily II helicase)
MNFSKITDTNTTSTVLSGVPENAQGYVYSEIIGNLNNKNTLVIAQSDSHMRKIASELQFFLPNGAIQLFPEWDCLPYDRSSPSKNCRSERVDTYTKVAQKGKNVCVITTMRALAQKIPPVDQFVQSTLNIKINEEYTLDKLILYCENNGYDRVDVVQNIGEYAVRGGIFDLFPSAGKDPYRLDFFGNTVESIKIFDIETQRTIEEVPVLNLETLTEVFLTNSSVSQFREKYRELFGVESCNDPLYAAISEKRSFMGYEHWLPLFYPKLFNFADCFAPEYIVMDDKCEESLKNFHDQVIDHFKSRTESKSYTSKEDFIYRPLDPKYLYLSPEEVMKSLQKVKSFKVTSFNTANDEDLGIRKSKNFAKERQNKQEIVYASVAKYIETSKKKILITSKTNGSKATLINAFIKALDKDIFKEVDGLSFAKRPKVAITCAPFDEGFQTDIFEIITEEDILGDNTLRYRKRSGKKKLNLELENFKSGDLLVHKTHGIGRYIDLQNIPINDAAHDCLELEYDNGDKLFVPVENIDDLSIYGNSDTVSLDRLGGNSWQNRKEKVQERIFEIAEGLMSLAAKRQNLIAESIPCDIGLYNEFCKKFPYIETEDQLDAVNDIINDMAQSKPMDRLLCGDVGFGKTEVAMRAAFIAAAAGFQVAVVVPTTILCHQHYESFIRRFKDFGITIAFLSRLQKASEAKKIKEQVEKGEVQIIIGTHTLLSSSLKFSHLGLVILDEEQHFGVKQKEHLKNMAENVHVLSMSATPIPRTLQMAVSGIRELSIIATPPIDRLSVNTFVMPFDSVTIREVVLREYQRGGQVFCVCPRVSDIEHLNERLLRIVPEVRIKVGHGQMPPEQMADVMRDFENHKFDVLISTNIIESGLDIPNANTLIVYRSDMFGLSQLHQLRGRVGRSKIRGYAYFTLPPDKILKGNAEKRLEIIKSIQGLGAGFTLASHDMDIRGPGNLIGQQQSGQVKEVGIGLYNHMLEEALQKVKKGEIKESHKDDWTPTINLGLEILIPDTYVPDLNLRLSLYRRIGKLDSSEDIRDFTAEMIDRFGPLPEEMKNLINTIELKQLCQKLNIQSIDAGLKGILISFYKDQVSYIEKLLEFINTQNGTVKLRPDSKMVLIRAWGTAQEKLKGMHKFLSNLVHFCF